MKPTRAVAVVVLIAALGSCSASTTETLPGAGPAASAPAITTAQSTSPTHPPFWINVKYRPDPVDVADPRFVYLDGGQSSLVDAAFYDASNEYMIVSLDGTAYHYCDMPQSTWTQFTAASSLGSFYRDSIKGSYDCRTGVVPQY